MDIPFFYEAALPEHPDQFALSSETSKHCIQVLRMKPGEIIALTDGKGTRYDAVIVSADKKQTVVALSNKQKTEHPFPATSIAISFVKNAARMEWFLEKATEIGVSAIYPLIATRTERTNFKAERWENIMISAMLQSQQVWKPQLYQPVFFNNLLDDTFEGIKLIAHCEDGVKNTIAEIPNGQSQFILIGPEGDFTPDEIRQATAKGFQPVSLGKTRLRTETAGIVAAVLLQNR